jgi:molybdopterin-biosynthesis enzyme MoeA-like protein
MTIRLIITGNEVYTGLIQDRFQAIIEKKAGNLGADIV